MSDVFSKQLSALFAASATQAISTPAKQVVIYGAGGFGQQVARHLQQAGCEILFFIDKQPKQNFPWKIVTPDTVARPDADTALVFGIFNPYVDLAPLVQQMCGKGFQHIVTPVELYRQLATQQLAAQYWLTTPEQYWQYKTDVISGVDYFDDDLSREIYVGLWRYRLTGKPEDLPVPSSLDQQYTPADIPHWSRPLRLIDCGAFTGDTPDFMRGQGYAIEAIAAFEPDPANYARLVQTVTRWPELQECNVIPCGVFDSCAQLRFSAGEGGGSAISEHGNIVIQCISIDQCLPVFKPNLIKMDIEGAEPDALRGAENTIRRYRPGLAISAYHNPHHIWQLPRLIHEWNLGYKFYLRTHLHQGFDTVLYALPQ